MAFHDVYTHITPKVPLIASAPMRLISGPRLACAVTLAGGLGFLGAGSDASKLDSWLYECLSILAASPAFRSGYEWKPAWSSLPVGVGFLMWGISSATLHDKIIPALEKYDPAAVWLFAPRGDLSGTNEEREEHLAQLREWVGALRKSQAPSIDIWLQVGSVMEVRAVFADQDIGPEVDVLVVQGADAGGHGLVQGAGLISLLPEVCDVVNEMCPLGGKRPYVVAAGGLSTGAQVAATTLLGAEGAVLGTRFLASDEANLAKGYRAEVVRASDGGQNTVRSGIYDYLRGTRDWPRGYGGRGVVNRTYVDWMKHRLGLGAGIGVHGLSKGTKSPKVEKRREELEKLYKEAESKAHGNEEGVWGPTGRLTTYAGTGVGLVKKVMPAGDIVSEVQEECQRKLRRSKSNSG